MLQQKVAREQTDRGENSPGLMPLNVWENCSQQTLSRAITSRLLYLSNLQKGHHSTKVENTSEMKHIRLTVI